MRPHDIAVLLNIISQDNKKWRMADIAYSTKISPSEISESLHRSSQVQLIDKAKKDVQKLNFLDFLEFGLKYVFPIETAGEIRGIPTLYNHKGINFASKQNYVWPHPKGKVIGISIPPLYPKQAEAVMENKKYHYLLVLCDLIRFGKTRETQFAMAELKKAFHA